MKKNTHKKLIILEAVAFLGLLLLIILLTGNRAKKNVTLAEIKSSVLSCITDQSRLQESNSMGLKKYYGTDTSGIKEFCLYLPYSNMDASELLIIVMEDEAQADRFRKACENRLEAQKNVFESYGVEQMELLKNARLLSCGPYLAFIVGNDSDKCIAAFKNCVSSLF